MMGGMDRIPAPNHVAYVQICDTILNTCACDLFMPTDYDQHP
jgi:hypothetical protein